MATMAKEAAQTGVPIVTSREPSGPKRAGDKGSQGDQAFMDAVMIIGAAWVVLLFLGFTLRNHNH